MPLVSLVNSSSDHFFLDYSTRREKSEKKMESFFLESNFILLLFHFLCQKTIVAIRFIDENKILKERYFEPF